MNEIKLPPEFLSGNGIPVERATITRERMVEILTEAVEADRAALESPEVQALRMDAERLEFLIAEECQVKTLTLLLKGKRYHLYWPDSEETQTEWFTNPRAAIDAAM